VDLEVRRVSIVWFHRLCHEIRRPGFQIFDHEALKYYIKLIGGEMQGSNLLKTCIDGHTLSFLGRDRDRLQLHNACIMSTNRN
jgi:hypothetical protein